MGSGTEAVKKSISKCNIFTLSLPCEVEAIYSKDLDCINSAQPKHLVIRGDFSQREEYRSSAASSSSYSSSYLHLYTPCWDPHKSLWGCLHKQLEDIFGFQKKKIIQ